MIQTVDTVLTNATVLTMDANYTQYDPGAVAVLGNQIVAVGPEKDILKAFTARTVVNCNGKIVMPGLVNAHTHVPMTLLRGLADDLRLDVWLLGYMMPVEREFVSPEFVRLGTKLAMAEFIRGGITAFADMYYFEEDVAKATAEAGLRGVCGQTILKFPSPDSGSYEDALEYTRGFIQRWKDHPLIVPAVAPHAPYTCTDEILQASAALAAEFDVPLHIHLAETGLEVENMVNEHGMPVIPYVKKQRLFDAKVIAAHCVHIDDGEMHTLKQFNAGVAHNPSSNLKLASGIAPITRMLEVGVNVGLGTDGPASNNDLDMFEEMRLAAFLAKGSTGDPTVVPARTSVDMATHMGARVLHLGEITGSLEAGKRADLIVVDLSPLHNAPRFSRDPDGRYAQLVYAAKSTDVTDVMVDGQWLMRDHQLLTLNEAELLAEAQEYAQKIDTFLIQREKSVLSKLVAIEGATQEESFEVQAKVSLSDPAPVLAQIHTQAIEILRFRHYREFDTYFHFSDSPNLLRYREDEFIDEKGAVSKVRYRLTLIGPASRRSFPSNILLSRSRYLAQATHSLRFYREYFKPDRITEIEKDRQRWRVLFKGTEFFINVDRMITPDIGTFLEVKSRTWSRGDAEVKSELVTELLAMLNANPQPPISKDYLEIVES
ncbi:MAG: amidohydrolase family protein [Anaerolineales bacterium]